MKVISGANEWTKEIKCDECKAGLLVETGDVLVGHFGPSWGGEMPVRDIYCECAVCGSHIRLGAVPPLVDKAAEENSERRKVKP